MCRAGRVYKACHERESKHAQNIQLGTSLQELGDELLEFIKN